MYFLIKDHDLLKKCNITWAKVSADIKEAFGGFNKEFLKTKIKSHGDEVTDFYNKGIQQVDSNHTCLAVTSLDSVLKKDDNYYPQVFLKVCKYVEKNVARHFYDNLSHLSFSVESDAE